MFSVDSGTSAPATSWRDVDFIAVVNYSAGEIVILNSDGSETRLYSAQSDFTSLGGSIQGTVTAMARTDFGGVTTYEFVDHVNAAASDILAPGSRRFATLLIEASTSDAMASGDRPYPTFWAGGLAFDVADFSLASYGVTVDLEHPQLSTGAAFGGVAAGVDGLIGSAFADTLIGNSGVNLLVGGAGNDTLAGGGGGDILVGGSGSDWVSYAGSTAAVTVDLSDPSHNTGDAKGDVYFSIENIFGGLAGDTLIGNAGDNWIAGGAGNDTITTGLGNDVVVFGKGDGTDTVTDFSTGAKPGDGTDRIALGADFGIADFAQLVAGDHLVAMDGHVDIVLGGNDRIVLANVVSLAALSEINFKFQ